MSDDLQKLDERIKAATGGSEGLTDVLAIVACQTLGLQRSALAPKHDASTSAHASTNAQHLPPPPPAQGPPHGSQRK